jgi:uncharacterized membrane-anchored protein YhcB (DUF1043 family)
MDSALINTIIAVIGTISGAILGALITTIGTNKINNKRDKRYNFQVELISKESCRRTIVYLKAMIDEEYEEFLTNLEARVNGIKVIEKLLSELPIGTIPSKQFFSVYRIRETLQEIIFDLSTYLGNYLKTQQFVADAQFRITSGIIDDNQKEILKKEIDFVQKRLKSDYEERLYKNLIEYVNRMDNLIKYYHKLAQEIYELNKQF